MAKGATSAHRHACVAHKNSQQLNYCTRKQTTYNEQRATHPDRPCRPSHLACCPYHRHWSVQEEARELQRNTLCQKGDADSKTGRRPEEKKGGQTGATQLPT